MKLYKKNIFQTEIRASDDQTDEQIGTLGPEPLSKPAVLSLFLTPVIRNGFASPGKMGISALIGLKSAVLFAVFVAARSAGYTFLSLPLLHASLVSLLVAAASHPALNLPLLLSKSSDGSFPLWSLLLFSPFLLFVRLFVVLRRRLRLWPEPAFDEVAPGLYVGGWPSHLDRLPPGDPAVVDCTCELPRRSGLGGSGYLCLPTWDTRAPSPGEIELAVRWAAGKRSHKKPVFVHCAFGASLFSFCYSAYYEYERVTVVFLFR